MKNKNKLNLITKGLQEVIGLEEIKSILEHRNLKLYWGTATTGHPHIGYLLPLLKICHFIQALCSVSILFADLHAFLDVTKTDWNELDNRVEFYTIITKKHYLY